MRTGTVLGARSLKPPKRRKCMERWICTICQYVYDPAVGDPDNNVPAGTPFEEIPEGWVCPLCGAGKEVFEPA